MNPTISALLVTAAMAMLFLWLSCMASLVDHENTQQDAVTGTNNRNFHHGV
jgi:hypothetical protein